eukprot:3099517-Amphidinium_carterae.1
MEFLLVAADPQAFEKLACFVKTSRINEIWHLCKSPPDRPSERRGESKRQNPRADQLIDELLLLQKRL